MYLDEFVKYCPQNIFTEVFNILSEYVTYIVNNIAFVNSDAMEFI